ncbi:MAG: M15 family metallopeptidase [Symbiobacteriaceae bacterium]|nr:M15 family metallopeptidase [Symbiobacteriaceae bacterium]
MSRHTLIWLFLLTAVASLVFFIIVPQVEPQVATDAATGRQLVKPPTEMATSLPTATPTPPPSETSPPPPTQEPNRPGLSSGEGEAPPGAPGGSSPGRGSRVPEGYIFPSEIVAAAVRVPPSYENWSIHLVNLFHPLPEVFMPSLQLIEGRYTYNENIEYYYDARAVSALQNMLKTARDEGYPLYVSSSYRSKSYQTILYNNEVNSYLNEGYSEAEAIYLGSMYVAYPDTSEHQLGLAVDLVTADHYWLADSFEATPAFAWLQKNAASFGFVLRYPKEKTDITKIGYEPWHYRYVGQEHAENMVKLALCLEEYVAHLATNR